MSRPRPASVGALVLSPISLLSALPAASPCQFSSLGMHPVMGPSVKVDAAPESWEDRNPTREHPTLSRRRLLGLSAPASISSNVHRRSLKQSGFLSSGSFYSEEETAHSSSHQPSTPATPWTNSKQQQQQPQQRPPSLGLLKPSTSPFFRKEYHITLQCPIHPTFCPKLDRINKREGSLWAYKDPNFVGADGVHKPWVVTVNVCDLANSLSQGESTIERFIRDNSPDGTTPGGPIAPWDAMAFLRELEEVNRRTGLRVLVGSVGEGVEWPVL
ncbi:hypothetical protein VTJ49DRAFT_3772 [Mycothermus thermophilus]|uniref:Uncharacterized protein n=1 Tax=Humicola insolens TaxID=85995 RepID=A0ABR3V799_HUMIN